MKIKQLVLTLLIFFISTISYASDVQQFKLKNGLEVFVKVDKRAPVVVSQVWYRVGSSDEPNGITGISHVLEHMMFNGTQKHPKGQFSKIIADNGGTENAATNYDYTVFYQELSASRLAISFELEADRMQNLKITPEDFAREIKVVQEERRLRTDNNPQSIAYERLAAAAFIENPYHHPPVGWMSDLKQMTAEDAVNWYRTWYVPNNAFVVVTGDVDPQQVFTLAEKYFGPIQARPLPRMIKKPGLKPIGLRTVHINVTAQLPYLMMAYNVPSLKTASPQWHAFALDVIAAILDGGNSARMPRHLIREQAIASSIDVLYWGLGRYPTLFSFTATPAKGKSMHALMKAITNEINDLQNNPVSAETLQRIKNQMIAAKIFAKDSLSYQSNEIGNFEIIGLTWQDAENYVANIEKITPEQVQAAAKLYLIPDRLTVAILQPKVSAKSKTPNPDRQGA